MSIDPDRVLLCIHVLRRFAHTYPGLTRERNGKQEVITYRLGTLVGASYKDAPYNWFAGQRLPRSVDVLNMLNMTLDIVDEKDRQIVILRDEIAKLKVEKLKVERREGG